jgi:hypothetical protein
MGFNHAADPQPLPKKPTIDDGAKGRRKGSVNQRRAKKVSGGSEISLASLVARWLQPWVKPEEMAPSSEDGEEEATTAGAAAKAGERLRIRAGGVDYDAMMRAVTVTQRPLSAKPGKRAAAGADGSELSQSSPDGRRTVNVTEVTLVTQFSKDRCA